MTSFALLIKTMSLSLHLEAQALGNRRRILLIEPIGSIWICWRLTSGDGEWHAACILSECIKIGVPSG